MILFQRITYSAKKEKKTNWFTVLADEIHSYEEKTNMQRTLKKKTSNHYFQINMLLINISGWRTCIIQGQSKNLNTEYLVLMDMGIQNHINLEIHCFNLSQPCTHYYKKCINFFFLMCWCVVWMDCKTSVNIYWGFNGMCGKLYM